MKDSIKDKVEELEGYKFGYPRKCSRCNGPEKCKLSVKPYYRKREDFRLMLIGQDPTIANKKKEAKKVLMLDEANGQLRQWLARLFGEHFDRVTIYATNLVKCTFNDMPSTKGGIKFLKDYFENCGAHLKLEIKQYRPNLVITFGEAMNRIAFCGHEEWLVQ